MDNANSDKIVIRPIKVDLHIHSAASVKTRDKGNANLEVCTTDSIDILVSKLNENGINVCAITDHDYFDIDIYRKLKMHEGEGSLQRVLPGIEFTVAFDSDGNDITTIHIIAIFDDRDDSKLDTISQFIIKKDGTPDYDIEQNNGAFSETKFKEILQSIGLNVILIGHEKSAGQENKNDLSSLGSDKANEIILTEFIDAVEIRNRNRELQIKELIKQYPRNDIAFVLGSDCHDWSNYPYSKSNEIKDYELVFSTMKCLPTFEGLVMAITEPSRIRVGKYSFFNASNSTISNIEIEINNTNYNIPLSAGINVIIGDNSIGKSMLLHTLTNYKYLNDESVKRGYKTYCNQNGIIINTNIDEKYIFKFDDQGNLRNTLEEIHSGQGTDDYFAKYFPQHVDVETIKIQLKSFFDKCMSALKSKVIYNDKVSKIMETNIPLIDMEKSNRLTIYNRMNNTNYTDINNLISEMNTVRQYIEDIKDKYKVLLKNIGEVAINEINDLLTFVNHMILRYELYKIDLDIDDIKRRALKNAATIENERIREEKTDEDKNYDSYITSLNNEGKRIADAVITKMHIKNQKFEYQSPIRQSISNKLNEFIFVSELNIGNIDHKYINTILNNIFKKTYIENIINGIEGSCVLGINDIANGIKNQNGPTEKVFDEITQKINDQIDQIKERRRVTNKTIGIDEEPSAGLFGQLYFQLIANDNSEEGIYIVDQPEDQISQMSIKQNVLDSFRKMSQYHQVIMVTHNPQFVVNLDVDNVIALIRDSDSSEITIKNGALEYECNEYNILDVIAITVEGGEEVVRKRLKRYGAKSN